MGKLTGTLLEGMATEILEGRVWTHKEHFALLPVKTASGKWMWFKNVMLVKKYVGLIGMHMMLEEICFMEKEELTATILGNDIRLISAADVEFKYSSRTIP